MSDTTGAVGKAVLLIRDDAAVLDTIHTSVDGVSNIERTLVGEVGTELNRIANDGNSEASGTINRAYGQFTDRIMKDLWEAQEKFEMVFDPLAIRTPETAITGPPEDLVKADGTATGDGTTTEFYSQYHAVRSSIVSGTSIEVDSVAQDECGAGGSDNYEVFYDNSTTPNRGVLIKFKVAPASGVDITMAYIPETKGTILHYGCEFTEMPVTIDRGQSEVISIAAPYVAEDWIRVKGPVERNPVC